MSGRFILLCVLIAMVVQRSWSQQIDTVESIISQYSGSGIVGSKQLSEKLLIDYYNGDVDLLSGTAEELVEKIISESESAYHVALAFYVRGVLKDQNNDAACELDFYESLRLLEDVDTMDVFIEIQARKKIGVYMMERGYMTQAIDLYTDAIPYAQQYKEREVYSLLYNLGNVFSVSKHPRAILYYDSVESYAKRVKDYKKLAQVNLQKGMFLQNQNENEIESLLSSAYPNQQELRNLIKKPFCHNEAIISIGDSLRTRDRKYVGMAYHSMANAYMKLEYYDSALINFEKAIQLSEKANRVRAMVDKADLLNQMGVIDDHKSFVSSTLLSIKDELVYDEISIIFDIAKKVFIDDVEALVAAMEIEGKYLSLSIERQQRMIKMKETLLFDKTIESYNREVDKAELNEIIEYNTLLIILILVVVAMGFLLAYTLKIQRERRIGDALDKNDSEVEKILKRGKY